MGLFSRKKTPQLGNQQINPNKPISRNIAARLGAMNNQLNIMEGQIKQARKIERAPNVRRYLYRARQNLQIAINKLNK